MELTSINVLGWIFLTGLILFIVGVLLWYINRSMVELAARLDRSSDTPEYSYWQAWLLPKYRAGQGRIANEEFHDSVDLKARNSLAQFAYIFMALGAAIQITLWVYISAFVSGPVTFINV